MPIGMLARAIVTELNGNRHVRGSSLFARVDLRHALHHAAREVHGGGAPNALQRRAPVYVLDGGRREFQIMHKF